MKFLAGSAIILAVAAGSFLFVSPRTIVIGDVSGQSNVRSASISTNLPAVPEAPEPSSSAVQFSRNNNAKDLPNQLPLQNLPSSVKAIYLTAWSAGSPERVKSLVNMAKGKGINAFVIDIKDYSGYVSYAMDIPDVKASGAVSELRILKPNSLIKGLHDNGIYVIGRITVFQDPILAKAHPEWALQNKTSGSAWKDRHGLSWMDPAGELSWDYNISIAKDALSRGFDEINFDYVRFASDGDLSLIGYPFWDQKTPKHVVIGKFFAYLRSQLPAARLSADLFGLATVNKDDLGIGQVIEDAYRYFDYVCPMVYPSHYATGFLGYKNPADYPYEVIDYSLKGALGRLIGGNAGSADSTTAVNSSTVPSSVVQAPPFRAKLRPWLQAFDLGAVYTEPMVQKEIHAVNDVMGSVSASNYSGGYLFWDPSNQYKHLP